VAQAALLGVAVVATVSADGESVTIKPLRRKEEMEVRREDAVKHIRHLLHAQPSRSIGRFKPRQGTISPPPERRAALEHHAVGNSGSATSLKVLL